LDTHTHNSFIILFIYFSYFYFIFFRTTTKFITPTVKRNILEERILNYLQPQRKHFSTPSHGVNDFITNYTSYDSNITNINNSTDVSPDYTTDDPSTVTSDFYITKEKVDAAIKDDVLQTVSDITKEQFTSDYTNNDVIKLTTDKLTPITFQHPTTDHSSLTTQFDTDKSKAVTDFLVGDSVEKLNDTNTSFTQQTVQPHILLHTAEKKASLILKNKNDYRPLLSENRSNSEDNNFTSPIYDDYEITVEPHTYQDGGKLNGYKYVNL
jgi:hypothetical protein